MPYSDAKPDDLLSLVQAYVQQVGSNSVDLGFTPPGPPNQYKLRDHSYSFTNSRAQELNKSSITVFNPMPQELEPYLKAKRAMQSADFNEMPYTAQKKVLDLSKDLVTGTVDNWLFSRADYPGF